MLVYETLSVIEYEFVTRGAARLRRTYPFGPFEPDLVYTSVGKWRTNNCSGAEWPGIPVYIQTASFTGAVFLCLPVMQKNRRR